MRNFKSLFAFSLIVLIIASSCKKDDPETLGCTDCNATNFNSEATLTDNSCTYNGNDYLVTYSIKDSVTAPPGMDYTQREYEITISRPECSPNDFLIENYASLSTNSESALVEMNLSGANFTIPEQEVSDKNLNEETGRFSGDSIYYSFSYTNSFGEPVSGDAWGVKK